MARTKLPNPDIHSLKPCHLVMNGCTKRPFSPVSRVQNRPIDELAAEVVGRAHGRVDRLGFGEAVVAGVIVDGEERIAGRDRAAREIRRDHDREHCRGDADRLGAFAAGGRGVSITSHRNAGTTKVIAVILVRHRCHARRRRGRSRATAARAA